MSARAEERLREMRRYLAHANEFERVGKIELADAAGAIAANKLAQAIRIAANVVPIQ